MKKIVLIVVSIIALVILGEAAYLAWNALTPPDDEPPCQEEIAYLNKDVDLEVMLYGNDILFPPDFRYTKVDGIGEDVISVDSDFVYLIINDFDGEVSLSKDKLVFLANYADKHSNFNFFISELISWE